MLLVLALFTVSLVFLHLLPHLVVNTDTPLALPGIVASGITRKAEGAALKFVIAAFSIFGPFINIPPEECGEFHLMVATSARYPPRRISAESGGVPLVGKLEVARGVDGKMGSGVYSINEKGESASLKVEKLLEEYRQNGIAEKVVSYVAGIAKKLTDTAVVSV